VPCHRSALAIGTKVFFDMDTRTSNPVLRLATHAHLVAINDIYNLYVINSTCTYQNDPETIENRKEWFREHSPDRYP